MPLVSCGFPDITSRALLETCSDKCPLGFPIAIGNPDTRRPVLGIAEELYDGPSHVAFSPHRGICIDRTGPPKPSVKSRCHKAYNNPGIIENN